MHLPNAAALQMRQNKKSLLLEGFREAFPFNFSWFFFCSGDIPKGLMVGMQAWLVSWLTRQSMQTQHQRHRLAQNKRVFKVFFLNKWMTFPLEQAHFRSNRFVDEMGVFCWFLKMNQN